MVEWKHVIVVVTLAIIVFIVILTLIDNTNSDNDNGNNSGNGNDSGGGKGNGNGDWSQQPGYYGPNVTQPDRANMVTAPAPDTSYVNAEDVDTNTGMSYWEAMKYWIGNWTDVVDEGGNPKIPTTYDLTSSAATDLIRAIPVRPSVQHGAFAPCTMNASNDASPTPQTPTSSGGFNPNVGRAFQLLYGILADNVLLSRVLTIPDSSIPPISYAQFQWGIVDGFAASTQMSTNKLFQTRRKIAVPSLDKDVVFEDTMLDKDIESFGSAASSFLAVKLPPYRILTPSNWQSVLFNRQQTSGALTLTLAPTPASVGSGSVSAKLQLRPQRFGSTRRATAVTRTSRLFSVDDGPTAGSCSASFPQVGTPGGTYTCSANGTSVTVTSNQQYPYCIDNCGSGASGDVVYVSGTCNQPTSCICGCACVGPCHGCNQHMGQPGCIRGIDIRALTVASVAASDPSGGVLANTVFSNAAVSAVYSNGGTGVMGCSGGYTLGPPVFSANTALPVRLQSEGGIVGGGPTVWPDSSDGALHDAFYDGILASRWGVLTAKGQTQLLTATLPTTMATLPLMDMELDSVSTYRQPVPTIKPVAVLRAMRSPSATSPGGYVLSAACNLTTAKWYGSGWYEVIARFPRVRGGVNAIWTFHSDASEPYHNPWGTTTAAGGTTPVPYGAPYTPASLPSVNSMGDPFGPDCNGALTLQRNDEIDIEIPTNAPAVAAPDAPAFLQSGSGVSAPMGWNTFNTNCYVYSSGGGSGSIPYINVPIVSSEAVVDGERYHSYGFQWVTGSVGKGGNPNDPSTWEVPPHINFYLDGAYVHTLNAFVPTRYSRLTIGFIATGGEPSSWHGEPNDWASDYVCARISEVHIVPYYNDRDSWWPMPSDQPVQLRFPSQQLNQQLWLPLEYALTSNIGHATPIPWDTPYWGSTNYYGASCGAGSGGVAIPITQSQFQAWLQSAGVTPVDVTSVLDVIPRDPTLYAAFAPDAPCFSAQIYQCPNLPMSPPVPCTITPNAQMQGRQSQADTCGSSATTPAGQQQQQQFQFPDGRSGNGPCAPPSTPGCTPPITFGFNGGPSTIIPCTVDSDCAAAVLSNCAAGTVCANGTCTVPVAGGEPSTIISAYCNNTSCHFSASSAGNGSGSGNGNGGVTTTACNPANLAGMIPSDITAYCSATSNIQCPTPVDTPSCLSYIKTACNGTACTVGSSAGIQVGANVDNCYTDVYWTGSGCHISPPGH